MKLFHYSNGVIEPLVGRVATSEQKDLDDLILKDPSLIPGDQIDPEDPCRWLVIGPQIRVPNPESESPSDCWFLDILLVDHNATLTLIECKRFKSHEVRKAVIGQLLEYAANAQHYWTAEELRDQLTRRHSREQLNRWLSALGAASNPGSLEAFLGTAIERLRNGEFRLVFAVDHVPRRLASTAEFLNRQLAAAEVHVVEIKRYSAGTEELISSRVFGFTEDIRATKREAQSQRAEAPHSDSELVSHLHASHSGAAGNAAAVLLRGARDDGGTVRYGPQGSALMSLRDGRVVVGLRPSGILEWYVKSSADPTGMSSRIRQLAERIGCSSASHYPTTRPEQWTPRVSEILTGLHELHEAADRMDS